MAQKTRRSYTPQGVIVRRVWTAHMRGQCSASALAAALLRCAAKQDAKADEYTRFDLLTGNKDVLGPAMRRTAETWRWYAEQIKLGNTEHITLGAAIYTKKGRK